jgi:hypothetical protein
MNKHKVKVYVIANSIGDLVVFPSKCFAAAWRGRVTDPSALIDGVYLDGWRGREEFLADISPGATREINTVFPTGCYVNEDSACALFGCEY